MDVVDDFDSTLVNLGRNVQSLQERGLGGFKTSVTSGDDDLAWSDGTSTSRGSNLVGIQDLAGFLQIILDEDEANIALHQRKEPVQTWVGAELVTDSFANHGVLTHENYSLATESNTDLLHLIGSDIVSVNDEDLGVIVEKLVKAFEIFFFALINRHYE